MVLKVKALVEKEGNICLLFGLSEFKWEKMEAWLQDLKFGSEFRHEIQKMAIVGDKTWEKWIAHLAKPFLLVTPNSSTLSISTRLGLGFESDS
ncbi:MAG: STAS/SEC14 domain-containing protein [Methanothrix sp.]|nr:STAS/SEC14 domain-containing protein [Methanothrix sp.]